MVLLHAPAFLGLGELTSYEALRGAGALVYIDTLEAFDKETGKPVPYNPETMPLHMKSKREYA